MSETIETKEEVAKALLELFGPKGEHWTQGANAIDDEGNEVDPTDDEAARFCIYGGLERLGDIFFTADLEFCRAIPGLVSGFNDNNDWPTVKAKLESIAQATN